MNAAFSKNITILRKERKLTQKKVAEDLGVSQALLSHYEKNIRECGLDFVVRMSEYFDVSCDFLLGATDERGSSKKKIVEEPPVELKTNNVPSSISSALNIVFGIVKKINSKSLHRFVINYFSTSIYTMFRTLYSANDNNSQEIFDVTPTMFTAVAESDMSMSKALCELVLAGKGKSKDRINKENIPTLDKEKIIAEYGEEGKELLELLEYTENIHYYTKG